MEALVQPQELCLEKRIYLISEPVIFIIVDPKFNVNQLQLLRRNSVSSRFDPAVAEFVGVQCQVSEVPFRFHEPDHNLTALPEASFLYSIKRLGFFRVL